jgi:putative ABC transport system permease protein
MNLWYYAKREIAGRPMHTVLNALTVAIGVAMIITLFSVSMAYEKAVTSPFTSIATDIALSRVRDDTSKTPAAKGVILPSANQAIDLREINRLCALPEVKEAAAALLLWSFDPGQFKVIVGMDPNSPAIGPSKAREWIKEGRFFEQGETGVAVLESHYAKFYGLKVGDHLTIAEHQFPVVGVYEVREGAQLTSANIYLPLADAQILAGVDNDTVNSIYLKIKDASRWRHVVDTINQEFPGLTITSADSALAMSDSLLALLYKLSWPAAIIVIAVCVLFVHRSLASTTWERLKEFGTMKALGWRHRDISRVLTLELFFQVALGAMLGLVLGAFGSFLSSRWQIDAFQLSEPPPLPGMAAATNAAIRLPALFPGSLYVGSLIGALVVGLFVALLVARKAAAIRPSESWRRL